MVFVAVPVKLYSSFGLRYSWYVTPNFKKLIRKEGLHFYGSWTIRPDRFVFGVFDYYFAVEVWGFGVLGLGFRDEYSWILFFPDAEAFSGL